MKEVKEDLVDQILGNAGQYRWYPLPDNIKRNFMEIYVSGIAEGLKIAGYETSGLIEKIMGLADESQKYTPPR